MTLSLQRQGRQGRFSDLPCSPGQKKGKDGMERCTTSTCFLTHIPARVEALTQKTFSAIHSVNPQKLSMARTRNVMIFVRKTIYSPVLTHKIASSLSLMRRYVLVLVEAYLRPKPKLTHKPALKSSTQNWASFFPKFFLECFFGQ